MVADCTQMSRLPDHLQLLVLLSLPPQPATLTFAEEYLESIHNPPTPAYTLTWKDILAEEPFEGQHWEGAYGLTPGSTVENWESRSNGSTPSLSPWDDDSDGHGEDSLSFAGSSLQEDDGPPLELKDADFSSIKMVSQPQLYAHRDIYEKLKASQYWRPEWHVSFNTTRPFSLGEPSTLGSPHESHIYLS